MNTGNNLSEAQSLFHSAEIVLGFGRVDSLLARLPVGRADLAVLFDELECLEYSKSLFRRAANRKIVHGGVSKDTIGVD